jgi:hypothetical protein
VPRKTEADELGVGSTFLTQVSPRSTADSPSSVVPSMDYQFRNRMEYGAGDNRDEIEDLIIDGESRKNMMHGTRGIAQLAAHRRANRNGDISHKNGSYTQFV